MAAPKLVPQSPFNPPPPGCLRGRNVCSGLVRDARATGLRSAQLLLRGVARAVLGAAKAATG